MENDYMVNYGDVKDLNKLLLFKRIVEWNENKLVLEDGTVVTIEESEQDCCASAGGTFSNVKLDAAITCVDIGEVISIPNDYDTTINQVIITLFHNQNPIALAEMKADAGNAGLYYSIASFVVNDVHYKMIEA